MSYAVAGALQAGIYDALISDPQLAAIVGASIFDQAPSGVIAGTYVSLGEEIAKDASDLTCQGARHDLVITVVTDEAGFAKAKSAAAAVCDVLIDANLSLSRGNLISLNFLGARAVRTRADAGRRIDLRFHARTEDN